MNSVSCTGTELSIKDCRNRGWTQYSSTYHSYDSGVICRDVRLINGSNLCSGRVEVEYNYQWGTVCDAGWDLTDAAVVCKSMDCRTPVAAKTRAYFGQGSGSVWLDSLKCSGNESTVTNCSSKQIGTSNCSHGQDAGVICNPPIRLVNGSNPCSGRVEVYHNGTWGTVCSDSWSTNNAIVVCREAGCPTNAEAKINAYFGSGVGRIWMNNVQCAGNEWSVKDCYFPGWSPQNCAHSSDAGVICRDIRLVNGPNPCSGRVEVEYNYKWGTVCDAGWNLVDAAVVCNNMGCGTPVAANTGAYFGQGSGPVWMENVKCSGNESTITSCPSKAFGTSTCSHGQDAGVICNNVRLVNGANQCSGRVEVLYNNQWGTVCDAGWDSADAAVVCNSLGCRTPVAAKTGAFFGQGSGPVWLEAVGCSGNELTVKNCPSKALGTSTCSHGRDAGVVCNYIRLVNGVNMCSGRVEVLNNYQWGTVCDAGWNLTNAALVCKRMGCGTPIAAPTGAFFGQGSGPVWLDDVICSADDSTAKNCPLSGIVKSSCGHGQDAGVVCQDIKLVNGTSPCDGRIQVLYNNLWGGVCHTAWGPEETAVLCSELGCGEASVPQSYVGPFVEPIWMDNVICIGNELTLRDCSFTGYNINSCVNGLYAGAVCIKTLRKDVVRIMVTANAGLNVNNLNIMAMLMDKIRKVVKSKGNYLANWKTQHDGIIFHHAAD
ncbi:scavenger receptor cysteine-rich domain-containing protein DMBT1-like [Paramisgurnus dabryanus]|uniref:scavenger receptor cysteine-rich domain-containing protein DMBT1-like n=1 Tax=Paramisgurnus dabryanus TaxID=90735 RepID=UPI003CCF1ED4